MRYVCKIYEDGTLYAYESTDDAWKVKKSIRGTEARSIVKNLLNDLKS